MTERHHYKYVVLDSSKENGNAVQARFNVQIPHGITNASRVCVKSFSKQIVQLATIHRHLIMSLMRMVLFKSQI